MIVFNLFQAVGKIDIDRNSYLRKWMLQNKKAVYVTFESLGRAKHLVDSNQYVGQDRYLLEIKEHDDDTKRNFIFIRRGSGLVLVDTAGNLTLTHFLLDEFMEQSLIRINPLKPSIRNLTEFIMEGEILRLNVATRYGIEDISQKVPFDWSRLERNPLISVSLELDHQGPFQIRIGSGSISIFGDIDRNRIEYVAQLIEKHLLNGETLLESGSTY